MNTISEKLRVHHHQKVHFNNEAMDYYLSRVMSYASHAGAEHGECLRAASQIIDGDTQSWVRAWQHMAQQVESSAMAALDDGHLISAREAYLRASTYYRAAIAFLPPADARFLDTWEDMRSCFRMASALFQPTIKHIEVPFEGKTLPGYFMRAGVGHAKRPTLIMIGGGDMFAEELYFWAAAPGAIRGYNTLFVELPGQGSTPLNGLFYRVNAEEPMKAVVDYALSLVDVDPDRLYAYGVSSGGYMVARGAAYDSRIKACVLNAPVTNIYKLIAARLPEEMLHKIHQTECETYSPYQDNVSYHRPVADLLLDKICWQAGTTSVVETLALAKWAHMGEIVCQIECPTFCLVSEGEIAEQNEQAREFYNDLNAPKQMRVCTADEGAEEHCQANNLSVMHAAVFDWLDEL